MNQPLTNTQALSERIESRIDPSVTTSLSLTNEAGGINLENMTQVMELAKMMAVSDIAVPKHLRNNPGACLAVAIQAFEWKMTPFAVAKQSYVVSDQLAFMSQLIQSVVTTRAPIIGRVKTEYLGDSDKRQIRVWAQTTNLETVEYLSPEIGKINPKNSPLWKNDPDQQLHYFGVRSWCRRHFPDVLLGVYAADELEDSAPMKDVTAKPSGLAARLAGATNGFDPEAVTSALDETAKASATVRGHTAAQSEAATIVDGDKVVKSKGDPELVRAGAQAFSDGEDRLAPLDFGPAESRDWLEGFDAAKASAEADQQQADA